MTWLWCVHHQCFPSQKLLSTSVACRANWLRWQKYIIMLVLWWFARQWSGAFIDERINVHSGLVLRETGYRLIFRCVKGTLFKCFDEHLVLLAELEILSFGHLNFVAQNQAILTFIVGLGWAKGVAVASDLGMLYLFWLFLFLIVWLEADVLWLHYFRLFIYYNFVYKISN